MRMLIHGMGSAGMRHAANAQELGHEVLFYDPPKGFTALHVADAAIVATPPYLHLEQTAMLLLDKIPVLVEKPFCLPTEAWPNGWNVYADASNRNIPFMVGHNLFWSEDWRRFRESIPEPPQVYRATFAYDLRKQLNGRKDSYQRHRDQGGGVLLDCVQDIALALDVVGPVDSVQGLYGRLRDVTEDADDCADLAAHHATGFISWHFDYLNPRRIRRHEAWGDGWYRVWNERPDPESYKSMLKDFLTWVKTGHEPAINPDPFSALEVIRQCQ